jgi:hypothetical protein
MIGGEIASAIEKKELPYFMLYVYSYNKPEYFLLPS